MLNVPKNMGGADRSVLCYLVTASMVALFASGAQAQVSDLQPIEEIVVTGSRIAGASKAQAVTVLGSAEFDLTGSGSVDEVLRELPMASGSMTGAATNSSGNGVASINLRGLGEQRTLVLVNGRRAVATDNLGNTIAVDLNTIPAAMVERIEVLHGGASAIYGSDAIGGVINVILKKDFEGVSAEARYFITEEGDGAEREASLVYGWQGSRGGVVLGGSIVDREQVMQGDRSSSECFYGEVPSASGWDIVCVGSGSVPGGTSTSVPGATNMLFTGDGEFRPYVPLRDSYNFAPGHYFHTPQERISLSGDAHYELAPEVTAFGEVRYTHRDSSQQLAAGPLTNVSVPIDNPFIPEEFRALALQANPDRATINLNRRLVETGPRGVQQDADALSLTGGLRGDFYVADRNWSWDAYYQYGRSKVNEEVTNQVRYDRLADTLNVTRDASGNLVCASGAPGCVPVNLFGPNTVTPEGVAYVTYLDQSQRVIEQNLAALNISGSLLDLPAGPLGVAVGGEWRNEEGEDKPDPAAVSGLTSGSNRSPTQGDFTAVEAYLEVNAPLLSGLPFAEYVGVGAAVRVSDYDVLDNSLTSYRIGAEWSPVESVNFRGNYSRAFRAPNIREMFAGASDTFPTATDPCSNYEANPNPTVVANCAAEGVPVSYQQPGPQVRGRQGGNSSLSEETADTWTFGVGLTPEFAPGLSLKADYYRIEISEVIGTVPASVKLRDCYASVDRSSPYCADITRFADNSPYVQVLNQNVAGIKTSGLDMAVSYTADLPADWGGLSWDLQATRLFGYEQTNYPGAVPEEYAGFIGGTGIGSYTKWRGMLRTAWEVEGLTLAHTLRYIGEARNFAFKTPGSSATNGVPEIWYNDVVVRYEVNDLTFTAGVNNLFDRDPPYYRNPVEGNTDGSTYDVLGRSFFVTVSSTF